MESTQQQQQADIHHQDLGNKNINGGSSYGCSSRQSSSRWTPTSDQIRILKELYYTNGIRSPTADQIQRIAAQLRQYGKIEGKNVFYWFQNHKARERQKKRFTPPAAAPSSYAPLPPQPPFSDHHHLYHHHQDQPLQPHVYGHPHKLYTTHHIGVGSSSSHGLMAIGCGYGSVAMEKSFRECSISPPGESRASVGGNFGSRPSRVGGVVSSCSNFFDKMIKPKTYDQNILSENHHCEDELDEGGENSREIETLPLFPIHNHDFFSIKASSENNNAAGGGSYYTTGGNWYRSDGRASLELSLSSYGGGYYS